MKTGLANVVPEKVANKFSGAPSATHWGTHLTTLWGTRVEASVIISVVAFWVPSSWGLQGNPGGILCFIAISVGAIFNCTHSVRRASLNWHERW